MCSAPQVSWSHQALDALWHDLATCHVLLRGHFEQTIELSPCLLQSAGDYDIFLARLAL